MTTITDPLSGVRLEMPEGWALRSEVNSLYSDPKTPQYNFLFSLIPESLDSPKSVRLSDLARQLCARQPFVEEPRVRDLSSDRALASYRTEGVEQGQRKADRKWIVVERQGSQARCALFTLSVLADQAAEEETEALARSFTRVVAGAVLPKGRSGPPRSVFERVGALKEVIRALGLGLRAGLDDAPVDDEGVVAASLALVLFWLSRLRSLPDDEKALIAEALSAQVIADHCAICSQDQTRRAEVLAESEPRIQQRCQTIMSALQGVFSAPEDASEDQKRKAVVALGLRLVKETSTLFEGESFDPNLISQQTERVQKQSRALMMAPILVTQALDPGEASESGPARRGCGGSTASAILVLIALLLWL